MKKTIVSVCAAAVLLIAGLVCVSFLPSDIEVPAVVSKAFSEKYPEAKDAEWEQENENETAYEAEFKLNKKEMSAVFSANGTWLQTETEVDEKDLPAAVTAAIKKTFSAYKIEETELLERPNVPLAYEVELETKDDKEIVVVFTADGSVLKQSTEEVEDQD